LGQVDLIHKEEAYDIIGACMDVHSELGPGFLEAVYHEALLLELENRGIPYETNVKLKVSYIRKESEEVILCRCDLLWKNNLGVKSNGWAYS